MGNRESSGSRLGCLSAGIEQRRGPSASLTAAGLDVENDQEHGRNQNEQQAGDKAEIVGFHGDEWVGLRSSVGTVSPLLGGLIANFIARCGCDVAPRNLPGSSRLVLVWGRIRLGCRGLGPGGRSRRQGAGQGSRQQGGQAGLAGLGAGHHQHGMLHQGLAGQPPGLGSSDQLSLLHPGSRAQGHRRSCRHHVHKAGDALATATAVPQLSLEAIELDALTQGHLPQVLAGVALHIAAFTHKPDHRHGNNRAETPILESRSCGP